MKVWYPIKVGEYGITNVQSYIIRCQTDLSAFRLFLKSNYNNLRWRVVTNKLSKVASIRLLKDVDAGNIANQYMSNLQCKYDPNIGKCYYYVSDFVKCIGTDNSLNFVIRLIEYGDDTLEPMNWVRHSYLKFTDFVMKGFEK